MFIVDSSWFSWRQNDWHLLHNIVHGNHFDFNEDKSVRKWRFNRPKLGSKCNMDLWWDGNFKEIYLNSFWQQHGTQLERQLHWHWRGITCKSCSKFIVLWCLNTPYLLTFVQNAIKQTDIVKCADLQPSRQLQSFFSSLVLFHHLHTTTHIRNRLSCVHLCLYIGYTEIYVEKWWKSWEAMERCNWFHCICMQLWDRKRVSEM